MIVKGDDKGDPTLTKMFYWFVLVGARSRSYQRLEKTVVVPAGMTLSIKKET